LIVNRYLPILETEVKTLQKELEQEL